LPNYSNNNHHYGSGSNITLNGCENITFNYPIGSSNAGRGTKESEEDNVYDDETDAIQAKHKAGRKKGGTSNPHCVVEPRPAKLIDDIVQLPSEMCDSTNNKNPKSMVEINKWYDYLRPFMDQEQRQS
jgi:hypothetical protein